MRQSSVWGGGPEIVALSNALCRPIHVYELASNGVRWDSGVLRSLDMQSTSVFLTGWEVVLLTHILCGMQTCLLGAGADDGVFDAAVSRPAVVDPPSKVVPFDPQLCQAAACVEHVRCGTFGANKVASRGWFIGSVSWRLILVSLFLSAVTVPRSFGCCSFCFRRMACFGSPSFDDKQAIHILSADSRYV